MELLGLELTGSDVVHSLPALIGLAAALVRLVPAAASGARRHVATTTSVARIHAYDDPVPFGLVWARRYHPDFQDKETVAARKDMRSRTLWLSFGFAALAGLLTAVWGVLARHHVPSWSWWTGLVVGVAIAGGLALVGLRVKHDQRSTAARPRRGKLTVEASVDDARQHALAGLREIGARLVLVDGDHILAYSGIAFWRDIFLGDIVWVTLEQKGPRHTVVSILSTKADFVSRSRSRHNVTAFLATWATMPAARATRPRRGPSRRARSGVPDIARRTRQSDVGAVTYPSW